MIYFACKQCGKRFQRPDETAGTLVFCECGTGNRVPWESTVPAGEMAQPPRVEPAAPPRVLPVERDVDREPEWERPRPRRRWPEVRRRDPAFCFNHDDVPSEKKCADCGEAFCAGCVVELLGQVLCGPCKNYRLRQRQRPPRVSVLSIIALVGAIVVGGFAFFLLLMGITAAETNPTGGRFVFILLGGFALLLQLAVMVLGLLGLRDVERSPRVGGRAMAMSALATVLGSTILLTALAFLYFRNTQ